MSDLITVEEVDRLLKQHVISAPAVRCPLSKAAGRVLREDILADRDLPPFDRCMLDGYAVRAQDAQPGTEFTILARQHAGESTQPLPEGMNVAIEIMTGSMLPPGADAVIRYEDSEQTCDTKFRYTDSVALEIEEGVHRRASDYPKNTILLKAGAVLGPVEVGIAASCGYSEPLCSQLPRIAIFGTGDELVPVNATPEAHQIRESNLHVVENALATAGFHAGMIARLSDDEAKESERLLDAFNTNDVVIISGAVSKGRKDWIPAALGKHSEKIFHGVSQRPGKPMGFWKKPDGPVIFGLPGNPVSTLVATHRYVLPYLRASVGQAASALPKATLATDYAFAPPLTLFLPFTFNEDGYCMPCSLNNSGDYARLAGTDGFLELPQGESKWTAGSEFPYILWQR